MIKVANALVEIAGRCNACNDGEYKIAADKPGVQLVVTQVQIGQMEFRLCAHCNAVLKQALKENS